MADFFLDTQYSTFIITVHSIESSFVPIAVMPMSSTRTICFSLLFIACLSVKAQQDFFQENNAKNSFIQYLDDIYGIDQQLANGFYFENRYFGAKGHPYFKEDNFTSGKIWYHNIHYDVAQLNYDICNQYVLIRHSVNDKELVLLLHNEFLSQFMIRDHLFRKFTIPGKEACYVEVISEQEHVQCYYQWYKHVNEVINDERKLIHRFSDQKRKSFLVIEGKIVSYRNNTSFIRGFSNDRRKEIRGYISSHPIKVNKATNQEMKQLIEYCSSLFDQNNLQQSEA